jgi:uncharacterized protein YbjQ (UPF0145 family)
MIVSPGSSMVGKRVVRSFGLVYGNTIRARHVGRDILAGLKNIIGGEIAEYTKLMAEAREQAIDRMKAVAASRGANAVIKVQVSTSYFMGSASEILVYGEAVVVENQLGDHDSPKAARSSPGGLRYGLAPQSTAYRARARHSSSFCRAAARRTPKAGSAARLRTSSGSVVRSKSCS